MLHELKEDNLEELKNFVDEYNLNHAEGEPRQFVSNENKNKDKNSVMKEMTEKYSSGTYKNLVWNKLMKLKA